VVEDLEGPPEEDGAGVAEWSCAVCGTSNETAVEAGAAPTQKFTEDCRTCCRPNLLRIRVEPDGFLLVTAEFDE